MNLLCVAVVWFSIMIVINVPFHHMHLIKMIIIAPKSSATALVLVKMEVEDTKELEPMGMRTKNNWRKTILECDDESGVKQMLL